MAITGLQDFDDEEIVAAGKLNQNNATLEAKFSAIDGADLNWPLVIQGDIDFDTFDVTGLKRFWKVWSVEENGGLQATIDLIESAGGGCAMFPPNYEEQGEGFTVEVSSIAIVGCGKTSVLKYNDTPTTGYLLRTLPTIADFSLHGIYFDGNSGAPGSGQKGVILRQSTGASISNCWFQDFSGTFLEVTNDGSAGNASVNTSIMNCVFTDGIASATEHLDIVDADGCVIVNCRSYNAPGTALRVFANDSAIKIEGVRFLNCRVFNAAADGIRLETDTTLSTYQHSNAIVGCVVKGCGGSGIVSAISFTRIAGNFCKSNTSNGILIPAGGAPFGMAVTGNACWSNGADGIAVLNGTAHRICDNVCYGNTSDGISAVGISNSAINDNTLLSNGAYGILRSGGANCTIAGNVAVSNTTAAYSFGTATDELGHNKDV